MLGYDMSRNLFLISLQVFTRYESIFTKQHIPAKNDLRSMIDTLNESYYKIWITDKDRFEVLYWKVGEIRISKTDS